MDFGFLTNGFMPHGYCLRWDGPLLFVFISGNLGIALAYFLIPAALRHFVGKRKDLPYPHMFRLFAAFILSCGVTHLLKVWTLFQPQYWIEASVDLWTAGVSLITAALLWPLMPQALALRSPRELEEANKKLEEEIQARKLSQQQLQQARDQAIEASNLKSAFIANVSHELRTPLAGVLGMNELLLTSDLDNDQRLLAQTVEDSAKSLLTLVNDILDLSKIEAGKLIINSAPLNVAALVEEAASLCRTTASTNRLYIKATVDERLAQSLFGDATRISQVLLNLLGNAVKFTTAGGVTVKAMVVSEDDFFCNAKFEVTDTGIGIAEDEHRYLFVPFSQVDNSTTRKFQGTGLGLTISKRLVELMGGEIGFSSQKGSGSTFWFALPLKKRSAECGEVFRRRHG